MNGHITLELDKLNSAISQIDSQIWKLKQQIIILNYAV